jgi:hypothetical protein
VSLIGKEILPRRAVIFFEGNECCIDQITVVLHLLQITEVVDASYTF